MVCDARPHRSLQIELNRYDDGCGVRRDRHLQSDNMAAMRGTAERPGVAASSIEGELVFIYFGAAYWVRSMMRPAHAHGLATA
jgi:hypothetical protein